MLRRKVTKYHVGLSRAISDRCANDKVLCTVVVNIPTGHNKTCNVTSFDTAIGNAGICR